MKVVLKLSYYLDNQLQKSPSHLLILDEVGYTNIKKNFLLRLAFMNKQIIIILKKLKLSELRFWANIKFKLFL